MANKQKSITTSIFLGTFALSLLFAACNSSGDKKEPTPETPVKVEQPAADVKDTTGASNAEDTNVLDTRPVKTTD